MYNCFPIMMTLRNENNTYNHVQHFVFWLNLCFELDILMWGWMIYEFSFWFIPKLLFVLFYFVCDVHILSSVDIKMI